MNNCLYGILILFFFKKVNFVMDNEVNLNLYITVYLYIKVNHNSYEKVYFNKFSKSKP